LADEASAFSGLSMHKTGMTELEVVLAVARRSSFRGAAQELGMSTTAVSSAVAGLEARLKVRLFNRSTRSVALSRGAHRHRQRVQHGRHRRRGLRCRDSSGRVRFPRHDRRGAFR